MELAEPLLALLEWLLMALLDDDALVVAAPGRHWK